MPAEIDMDSYLAFGGVAVPTQTDWEDTFRHVLLDGVLPAQPFGTTPATTELLVFGDSSGMQVKVQAGRVLLDGHVGRSTSQKTLSVAAAHATLARYDLVVARLDRTNKKILLAVVTGTASGSPAVPALVNNATTLEIPLAVISVTAAMSPVGASAVSDQRRFAVPDTRGLPACRYRRTTDVTGWTSGLDQAIDFDAVGKMHDSALAWVSTSPSRFTAWRPGIYNVYGCIRWMANTGGNRQARIVKNGLATLARDDRPPVGVGETVQAVEAKGVLLAYADYLQLFGFQNSGSILKAETAVDYATVFSMELVRATS